MDKDISENKTEEFLIFQLMDEFFAFPAEKTIELVQTQRITFLPKMEDFFCGVMNLRGDLIPSVDLRLMLNMSFLGDTKDTVFILLDVNDEIESYSAAVKVDRVIAVEKIVPQDNLDAPESGSLVPEKYLEGSFFYKGSVVLVLSADNLLSPEELKLQ